VVLSPGSSGSSEDGLLEAWELMDLKLSADLVILSACETGRGRIAPGAVTLGNFLRHGDRVGKPVTQEEVAEAIGISRVWYATIESGGAPRVSPGVLGRLADALMLKADECELLYALGIPYLHESHLKTAVSESLESFWTLRWAAKRLWSATSLQEALTIATEAASPHFKDAILVFFVQQIKHAQWEHPYLVDRGGGDRGMARQFGRDLLADLLVNLPVHVAARCAWSTKALASVISSGAASNAAR